MRIGIVIPDGTGIRNYLFSDLVSELEEYQCEVILYHSVSKEAIDEIKKRHSIKFKIVELPVYLESPFQKFYREVVCYARLLSNSKKAKNVTILKHWNPRKKGVKNKIFYQFVEFLGRLIYRNYNKILKFEAKYDKAILKETPLYQSILDKTKPDVLFSTHQRSMNVVPLIKAAKLKGVPTVGAIFSWDNLPKARLTVRTDKYVVWSQHMKSELDIFYPEINNEAIEITGTPQFEFYKQQKQVIPKEEFFTTYNLDNSKKTICFSGDDELTSPYDPQFLQDVVEVIDKKKLDIQIVLRRAPVDVSGRFDTLIQQYPDIIKLISPKWVLASSDTSKWQSIFPLYADVSLLISTVKHTDAVINLGSTMALDFAMFDKPAVYFNYNPVASENWNVEMIYNFQHFRTMDGLNPVVWLNSKKDIEQILNSVLIENDSLENKEWLNKIAERREHASKNIAKYLVSCT